MKSNTPTEYILLRIKSMACDTVGARRVACCTADMLVLVWVLCTATASTTLDSVVSADQQTTDAPPRHKSITPTARQNRRQQAMAPWLQAHTPSAHHPTPPPCPCVQRCLFSSLPHQCETTHERTSSTVHTAHNSSSIVDETPCVYIPPCTSNTAGFRAGANFYG